MATEYQRFDPAEKAMKKHEKIKIAIIAFLVGAILAIVLFWGILAAVNKDKGSSATCSTPNSYIQEPTNEQSNAISDIGTVYFGTIWKNISMGDDDKNTLKNAYNVFDEDGDSTWSYGEFVTFQSFLTNHSSSFAQFDTDGDSTVSVREFVAHLLNIGGTVSDMIQKGFEDLVYDLYELDERNTASKSQKFYESIAESVFSLDKYGKGYFNLTDWQYMFYNISFNRFDQNNDDFVSFAEFLNGQFQENSMHDESKLNEPFRLFTNALHDNTSYSNYYIVNKYDFNDVSALNITWTCPITSYGGDTEINNVVGGITGNMRRRRLTNWIGCIGGVFSCAGSGIGTAIACSAGEVMTVGTDTAICIGGVLGTVGACSGVYGAC